MPLTLGFDTSAGYVCCALVSDGQILDTIHEDMTRGQAERLLPMLEELLARQNVDWSGLERIAVGVGPGNFTGIRISVSAARGLAMALDIPAIGVTSLELLSYGAKGTVRTAIDARRNHVYIQDFKDFTALEPPQVHDLGNLPASGPSAIVGPGAALAHQGETIVAPMYPPASAIALIGETAEPDGAPAPLYIRPPDADPPKQSGPKILDGV